MKRFLLLLALLFVTAVGFSSEIITERTPGGRVFATAAGDPFRLMFRKQDNGLTLYLAKNPEKPRISTCIIVKAGSVNDPANSTGLAHYFEHLMFKGSGKIASLDWKQEKPLLDRITVLFEQYRAEKDPAKRKEIYKEIDRVSGEAAKYSNDEYWTIVRNMGATGTNAFTSNEITAYVNNIPANMLDRFLTLEAERFSRIALRRFHTELETVYEEFNRSQDSDARQVYYALLQKVYPVSPFGRPVIGLPEHLKNPSVKDVAAFFDQYYVPGNMAVVLVGDLDLDKASEAVEKTFGKLPAKTPVRNDPTPEIMRPDAREITITGRESESVSILFRFARDRKTDYLFDLVSSVLMNGKCGLIDSNLNQPQKVLTAGAGSWNNSQDNLLYLEAKPLPGQTLEQLRDMLLAEVERIKKGDFDPALLTASANNDRLKMITLAESQEYASGIACELFANDVTMADVLNDLDLCEKATKEMVSAYAGEKLTNYAVVLKRSGVPADRIHAEKQPITPVSISDKSSEFANALQKIPAGQPPQVTVPDFDKEIIRTPAGNGFTLYSTRNKNNERFSLRFVFPAGSYHDLMLPLAMGYADMADTEKRSQSEFNKELYQLALSIDFSCGKLESAITVSGLQRHLPRALELMAERINLIKDDLSVWKKLVDRVGKDRENAFKNPRILTNAAVNYALYGKDNPVRFEVPLDEMRKITSKQLADYVRQLPQRPHDVVYYGPGDPAEVAALVKNTFKGNGASVPGGDFSSEKRFRIAPAKENTVYAIAIPGSTQVTAMLIRTDEIAVPGNTVRERLLSRYAGQLAFSELREKQSLGYIAGAYYTVPVIMPENYSLWNVYLGTQPDKLEIALNAVLQFSDTMPQVPSLFAASKENALSVLRSKRIRPETLYDVRKELIRLKRPLDEAQKDYQKISAMTPESFFRDAALHMKNGKNILVLVGAVDAVKPDLLKKYGQVVFLKPEMLLVK